MLSARTIALFLSPRHLLVTAKNIALWLRLKQNPEAWATWNQYFEPDQYLRLHPDVARAAVDPTVHFLLCGTDEERDASLQFETRDYLRRYPEVAKSRINPLLHYALFGKSEGRLLQRQMSGPEERLLAPAEASPVPQASPVVFINNEWRPDLPLVSVIIPCFNYGQFVEDAIHSILNQTFQDFELIVIEGGSTDGTADKVRRIESQGLPKTHFYYRPEPHCISDNRNFGIGLARGRYVCCLDADDMLLPVYLEAAVFLVEVFGYDFAYPSLRTFGQSDMRWLVSDPSFPEILEENQIPSTALFRRSVWAHVGGFRDFGTFQDFVHEDWDFWIRLLGHGFRGISIREPLHLYRVHEGGMTKTHRPDMNRQRERLRSANASLLATSRPVDNVRQAVLNPYVNVRPSASDPPGFLLALPFVTIGGAEKLFRTIGESIVARGERLVVITSLMLSAEIPEDRSCFDGITDHVYHLPWLFRSDWERGEFIRYLIRGHRIQTVMLAGCEFLYHLLPELTQEFPEIAVVDQLFNDTVHVQNNRRYAEQIHATVVPSEQLFRSLTEKHGGASASVHVIAHGINLPAESSIAEGNGLPAASRGKTIIGFFGRLSEEKGPDQFVEIARKLASHRDLFFVMTGQGPERDRVLKLIRTYGLEDRIYTPGFVADVRPLMRAADIVVLPSRFDGMPLVVLEAQALGKAVVASRVGSLPEMISDRVTGLLCDAGDVEDFCEQILRLAGDRKARESMGAAARLSVRRSYSAGQMVEAYDLVFRKVRENRSGKCSAHGAP